MYVSVGKKYKCKRMAFKRYFAGVGDHVELKK